MSHPQSCCRGKQGVHTFNVQFCSIRSKEGFPLCSQQEMDLQVCPGGAKIGWSEENTPSGRFPSCTSVGRAVKAGGGGLVTPEGIQLIGEQRWV